MVDNHFRWDFIGLSTDTKPTPSNSSKVVDGSTFYCSDTSKLYVFYKDTWYERLPLGGGGGTSDFEDLTNRPKYNSVTMDGDTNIPEVINTDFVGTDGTSAGSKGLVPAPATTDAGKFLKADGTWDTAGGSSVTVVQTTGTSTTDVMSQDATTKMVFANNDQKAICIGDSATTVTTSNYQGIAIGDNANSAGERNCIAIGNNATASKRYTLAVGRASEASANNATAIGTGAKCYSSSSLAIGEQAQCASYASYSVACGPHSRATRTGEFNIGTGGDAVGFSGSYYRVISGVYDGQDLHDGATVAQGNTLATSAPTTSTIGVLGQLYTDTTNMHTYQCTAISGDTYTWTQRW